MTATESLAARSEPRLRARRRLVAHLATVGAFVAWSLVAVATPPYLIPTPWDVAVRLVAFLSDANMWLHVGVSIGHVVAAVFLAVTIGTLLATLAYYVPVFRLLVHGRISPFLSSFAGIAWILIGILWFGLNDTTVIFAVVMVLLPFALINMRVGFESVDDDLLEMTRSFGPRRIDGFLKVVLPTLLPFLYSVARICFGLAWKVALTAELFGGNAGFGYLFNIARQEYDTDLVFVVITLIVAFVYSSDRFVFEPIRRRIGRHYDVP